MSGFYLQNKMLTADEILTALNNDAERLFRPLKPSGYYTYRQVEDEQLCICSAQ